MVNVIMKNLSWNHVGKANKEEIEKDSALSSKHTYIYTYLTLQLQVMLTQSNWTSTNWPLLSNILDQIKIIVLLLTKTLDLQ